eukprot:g5264.t1
MANAGVAFEVKYFVRTFEPFASKKDAQKALALWLFEEAARRWVDAGPGFTGEAATQYSALQREKRDVEEKCGPVRIWDLSLLSDLSALLRDCGDVAIQEGFGERYLDLLQTHVLPGDRLSWLHRCFNLDVSGWDVSGAIDLGEVFRDCYCFNSDISAWDVSKAKNFSGMFSCCGEFDRNLASWNVGKGVNFAKMFYGCIKFDQDLASWNVANGVSFSNMFNGCYLFNRNLDPWDVAKAKTMQAMFFRCDAFSQPLASWQVGRVDDFSQMFENCASVAQDISSWNVNETASLGGMAFIVDVEVVGLGTKLLNLFYVVVGLKETNAHTTTMSSSVLEDAKSGKSKAAGGGKKDLKVTKKDHSKQASKKELKDAKDLKDLKDLKEGKDGLLGGKSDLFGFGGGKEEFLKGDKVDKFDKDGKFDKEYKDKDDKEYKDKAYKDKLYKDKSKTKDMKDKKMKMEKDNKEKVAKQVLPVKKPGRKGAGNQTVGADGKNKKRLNRGQRETWQSYIHKVLKTVHHEDQCALSGKAMNILDSFTHDLFDRISSEAVKLMRLNNKRTLTGHEIQTAARLVLPGELSKHAIQDGAQAVKRYKVSDDNEDNIMEVHC